MDLSSKDCLCPIEDLSGYTDDVIGGDITSFEVSPQDQDPLVKKYYEEENWFLTEFAGAEEEEVEAEVKQSQRMLTRRARSKSSRKKSKDVSWSHEKIQKLTIHEEGKVKDNEVKCCTHCKTVNTPLWRTGPLGPKMGPKTLCNACGVRFQQGRLYPEYRPANSPTFDASIHSNSHRKVLEVRARLHHGGHHYH